MSGTTKQLYFCFKTLRLFCFQLLKFLRWQSNLVESSELNQLDKCWTGHTIGLNFSWS